MINYDYRSYISNSVIHNVVNELINTQARSVRVTQDNAGRTWKVIKNEGVIIQFTHEENGKISIFRTIINAIVLFFKCWSYDFLTKYQNAILTINRTRKIIPKKTKSVQYVPLNVFSKITTIQNAAIKKFDFASELLKTKYPNIDKTVLAINEYTGSFRLANVWARLLEKFAEAFRKDIVESVKIEKNGDISIILKKVQGHLDDEQYRMWIPGTKNPENAVEPKGGIVILLARKIVLRLEENKILIKQGYKNFVRIPERWHWFGEFNSADTTQMDEINKDTIRITVEKSIYIKTLKEERDTLHTQMDSDWKTHGEVILGNIANKQIIINHDHL